MIFARELISLILIGSLNAETGLLEAAESINPSACSLEQYQTYQIQCNVPSKQGIIKHRGTCMYTDMKGIKKQLYCMNGYWFEQNSKNSVRRKRGFRLSRFTKPLKRVVNLGNKVFDGVKKTVKTVSGFVGNTLSRTSCFIFGCSSSNVEIRVNRPPSITCPAPQPSKDVFAAPLDKFAIVTWSSPTYSDPEGDAIRVSGGHPASGSEFEHGYHTIQYTATDTHGNKDFCTIKFRVIVQYCLQSLYVRNGRAVCDRVDRIHGTICNFYCDDGYELTADSVKMKKCAGTSFTDGKIECKKKTCKAPGTLCNGEFLCSNDDYAYESVCFPNCDSGYETQLSRFLKCNGEKWDGYNTVLECKDSEPPTFDECPLIITKYADRGKSSASNVTWDTPAASDNSQHQQSCSKQISTDIVVTQKLGLPQGSNFPVGVYTISHEAKDGQGLTSICTSIVSVTAISCDPLLPADSFLNVRCPTGYTYGSTCFFSCFMTYVVKGAKSVTCELDETGLHGRWAWPNDIETFCERLKCPPLPPPVNGALTCSTVMGHEVCTMACNEKFQPPLKPHAQYECDDNQEWFPGLPPNCTKKRNPNLVVTDGDLVYYYSGECNDMGTQIFLKDKFESAMNDLANQKNWSSTCQSDCKISDITVSCGPTTGRRKREQLRWYNFYRFKRASNEIKISFRLEMKWLLDGDYWYNDDNIVLVNKEIEKIVNNGTIDYNGQTPNFDYSYSSFNCLQGLVPDYHTDSCRGCAPGTYLDVNSEQCKDCSQGSYQNEEFKISCIACPPGMSTEKEGSTSPFDCIEMCEPGSYSNTGVIPCSPCVVGKYQPSEGSTSCQQCDKGMSTIATGSNDSNNCTAFDVTLPLNEQTAFRPIQRHSADFSLLFWIFATNMSNDIATLNLGAFTFSIGSECSVSYSGNRKAQVVYLKENTWIQIALIWTKKESKLDFYIDGSLKLSNAFSYNASAQLFIGDMLTVHPTNTFKLSGLILYPTSSHNLLRTCFPNTTDSMFTMSEILAVTGIKATESKCDEYDECSSSPCSTGNLCINGIGGYTCKCSKGFTGEHCENTVDFCSNNVCRNGATCKSFRTNYTCSCNAGYKGHFCEKAIVNGGWSPWLEWTDCSKSCDHGTRNRIRFCDNPTPEIDGQNCFGNATDIQECATYSCPTCPSYEDIPGANRAHEFNCSDSKDHISCKVSCRDGFIFAPENLPPEKYECGYNTSFEWNSAKLPQCTRFKLPKEVDTKFTISYDASACNDKTGIRDELSKKIKKLDCVSKQTCNAEVKYSGCESGKRMKRATSDLALIVSYNASFTSASDDEINDFFESKIVSEGLAEWLEEYSDVLLTTQQMINDTNFYTVLVNGKTFETSLSTVNLTSRFKCSVGMIAHDAVCVFCPAGTYWKDGLCELCPIGTFQDLEGEQHCITCPTGLTTQYEASINYTDCLLIADVVSSTPSEDKKVKLDDDKGLDTTILLPVIVSVTLAVIIGIIVVALKKYQRSVRQKNVNRMNNSVASLATVNKIFPTLSPRTINESLRPINHRSTFLQSDA